MPERSPSRDRDLTELPRIAGHERKFGPLHRRFSSLWIKLW
jgi:hypothetical protein